MGRIHHYRFAQIRDAAERRTPDLTAKLAAFTAELATGNLNLPEQCKQMTARLWQESGLTGPAIVTGFGSIPYLATQLSDSLNARRLDAAARAAAADSKDRYGVTITCSDYFAGISDMSFFGEANAQTLEVVACNTPVWHKSIAWPRNGALGMIPVVNIGPWGRDYHTPLERVHTGYAFNILPCLLRDIIGSILQTEVAEPAYWCDRSCPAFVQ